MFKYLLQLKYIGVEPLQPQGALPLQPQGAPPIQPHFTASAHRGSAPTPPYTTQHPPSASALPAMGGLGGLPP